MKILPPSELKFIIVAGMARGLARSELCPLIRSMRVYAKHLEYMNVSDNVIVLRMIRRGSVRARKGLPILQRLECAAQYLAAKHYVECLRSSIDHALAA